MNPYFAVFNCHVNNALERTCVEFKNIWSEKKFEAKIQPILNNGIMSIFKEKPNKYTSFFVFHIQDVVNGFRQ